MREEQKVAAEATRRSESLERRVCEHNEALAQCRLERDANATCSERLAAQLRRSNEEIGLMQSMTQRTHATLSQELEAAMHAASSSGARAQAVREELRGESRSSGDF